MSTEKYTHNDLKKGDLVLIYIKRFNDSAMTGPSVQDDETNLTWVIYDGIVMNIEDIWQGYFVDTLSPIGLPMSFDKIVDVKSNEGLESLEKIYKLKASTHGGHFLLNYISIFNKVPIYKGSLIKVIKNYSQYNKGLIFRNNNIVLKSDKLVFEDWDGGEIVRVKCLHTNKIAETSVETISWFEDLQHHDIL